MSPFTVALADRLPCAALRIYGRIIGSGFQPFNRKKELLELLLRLWAESGGSFTNLGTGGLPGCLFLPRATCILNAG